MGYFQYQARDIQGTVLKGVLEAASSADAARKLKADRLYPVRIRAVRSGRRRRVPEDHIIRFFFDLSDLLNAGLSVDRALALISANQTHSVFQRVVNGLLSEVQGGSDLSGAVSKFRDVFGDLADHMVRAGEATGTTAPILKRLAQHLEQRREFKQSLISSMVYPSILFATSGISIIVLLVYVIPKFAQIFHDLNQEIPTLTRILLQAGVILKDYGWAFPLVFGALFFGGRYLYRLPRARLVMDKVMFAFPFTRYIILHSELTRFCRTMGTMIHSGVPLLRAIGLAEQILVNSVLKEAMAPLHHEIKVGHSTSSFFRGRYPFPARMATMLRISEEQGSVGEGLLSLGDHFEKELQRNLNRLMSFLEPAVIVVTGLVIGLMVISMFTAIFGINDIKF